MSHDATLELIKTGNKKVLDSIYLNNRKKFFRFANRYKMLSHEDIEEIYNDAILVLYHNIQEGKIDHVIVGVENYLYGIGRNLLRQKVRSLPDANLVEIDSNESINFDLILYHEEQLSSRQEIVKKEIEKIGGKCRKILTCFYVYKMKHKEIALELKTTESTIKTQKARCLGKLRETLKDKLFT